MKMEHKIGIGIICTFLCLCGAVIGLKMQEQTPSPDAQALAGGDPKSRTPEDPNNPQEEKKDSKSPESPKDEGEKAKGAKPGPNNGGAKPIEPDPLDGTKPTPKPIDPLAPSSSISTVNNPSSGPGLGGFPGMSYGSSKPTAIPPGGLTGSQLSGANNRPSASDNQPPLTRPKVEGSSEFGNYTPLSSPNKNENKSTSSTWPATSGSTMPKPIGSGPSPSTSSVSSPASPSIVRTSATDNGGTGTPLMPLGSGNKDQATPAASSTGPKPAALSTPQGGSTSTPSPKTTATQPNISGVGITPLPSETPSLSTGPAALKQPAPTLPLGESGIRPTGTGTPSPIGASTSPPKTPPTSGSSPASSAVPPYLMPHATGDSASGGSTSLQPGGPPPLATNPAPIPLPGSSETKAPPSSMPAHIPLPSDTPSGSQPPSSLMPSTSQPILSPSFSSPKPTPMSPPPSNVQPLSPSTSSTPPPPLPMLTPPPAPADGGSSFVPDSSTSSPRPMSAAPALVPVPTGSGSTARPASNEPAVTVYDEQTYTAQPGDTFESISKRFLNSGSYAKALQMHNQNHARAGREMANAGKLTPGEKVYIPPTSILEQRYAGAIANGSTPTILPASGTPFPNR